MDRLEHTKQANPPAHDFISGNSMLKRSCFSSFFPVRLLRDELNICYRGFKGKQIKPQCVRCRKNFGLWRLFIPFVYRGRRCQRCQFKSCKRCTHRQANGRYMCGICVRLRWVAHHLFLKTLSVITLYRTLSETYFDKSDLFEPLCKYR